MKRGNERAILVLAWTVPITFGVLAIGAVVRDRQLSGEAFGMLAAVLGGITAGVFTSKNNNRRDNNE